MVLQKYVSQRELHSLTHEIKCVHESFLTQEQPMALRIFNFNITEGTSSSECRQLVRLPATSPAPLCLVFQLHPA
jgi:hypothetical protein